MSLSTREGKPMSSGMTNEFLLEKYRYVMDQKKNLNDNVFKIVALYQASTALVAFAQYTLLQGVRESEISKDTAIELSWWVYYILIAFSALCIIMVVGGVYSWRGYRRDQIEIETQVFGVASDPPSWRNAWRWYETYIIAAIVVIAVLHRVTLTSIIVPFLTM